MNKQFKNITSLLIIFAIGVIQVTLVPYFGIMGLWPNLIFLLAITFILIGAEQEAYLTASFGGLILDFASPIFFGFNVLILMSLVGLTQLLTKKFLSEIDILMAGLVYVVATFIFNLIFSLVGHQFGWPALIVNVIYSLIVGLVMFYIVSNWFDRREF